MERENTLFLKCQKGNSMRRVKDTVEFKDVLLNYLSRSSIIHFNSTIYIICIN